MDSQYANGLSKQAILAYKLLIGNEQLSAREIGRKLRITPHSVYRLIRHLEKSGLVEQLDTYPLKYRAKSINEGLDNYLMKQRGWFSELFAGAIMQKSGQAANEEKPFGVTFIQSREESWDLLLKDIDKTRLHIRYITNAIPMDVPTEWIYTNLQALRRGINLKVNALEHTKENHNLLMSYKHIGAEVKLGKSPGWHLYLFDDDIAYITMFDSRNKAVQTGVRFIHRGINRELQGIFEKYWTEAEPI